MHNRLTVFQNSKFRRVDLLLKPLKLFTLEDTAVVEVRDEFPYTVRVKCQAQLTTTHDLC